MEKRLSDPQSILQIYVLLKNNVDRFRYLYYTAKNNLLDLHAMYFFFYILIYFKKMTNAFLMYYTLHN